MILLVDNYDSFTYNLAQLLGSLGQEVRVFRNDAITVNGCQSLAPQAIVLSPGPGRPENAGVTIPLIQELVGRVPILGVCLGHQCLASAFGGETVHATSPMHGKTCDITHDGQDLFESVPSPCTVARYHSLMVEENSLPPRFAVTARSEDNSIMGISDRAANCHGIQFHPESFLTLDGMQMMSNFISTGASVGI